MLDLLCYNEVLESQHWERLLQAPLERGPTAASKTGRTSSHAPPLSVPKRTAVGSVFFFLFSNESRRVLFCLSQSPRRSLSAHINTSFSRSISLSQSLSLLKINIVGGDVVSD